MQNFKAYGFDFDYKGFNWPLFKARRDDYIKRLNGIYQSNLGKSEIEVIQGTVFCILFLHTIMRVRIKTKIKYVFYKYKNSLDII